MAEDHAQSLVMKACAAIESRNLVEVHSVVTELEQVAPRSPETRVLQEFASRLQQTPGARLLDVLVRAWKAAGRPMKFSFLPTEPNWLVAAASALDFSEGAEKSIRRMVDSLLEAEGDLAGISGRIFDAVRTGQIDELVRAAIRISYSAESLPERLIALPYLQCGWAAGELKAEANQRAHELRAAIEADLRDGLWAIAALRRSTPDDGPFSADERRDLGRIAGIPCGGFDHASVFGLLRNHYRLRSRPCEFAFFDAVAIVDGGWAIWLRRRARATVSEDHLARDQMAALLLHFGQVLADSPCFVEALTGLGLQRAAYEIRDDSASAEATNERARQVRELLHAATPNLERFPIPTAREELFEAMALDEIPFRRILLAPT